MFSHFFHWQLKENEAATPVAPQVQEHRRASNNKAYLETLRFSSVMID